MAALKADIEELKQKQNSKSTAAKTHEESTSENSKTMQHPKNIQEASEGGQLGKVGLLTVITFIEETMKTLATYRKQLKSQSDINLIQTDI